MAGRAPELKEVTASSTSLIYILYISYLSEGLRRQIVVFPRWCVLDFSLNFSKKFESSQILAKNYISDT